MKKIRWMALLLLVPLVLTSCADIFDLGFLLGESTPADQYDAYFEGITPVRGEVKVEVADISHLDLEYSERELSADYDSGNATRIVFSDGGSTVYGKGAETGGKNVTVTAAGTYIVSGSATGALLTVNVSDEEDVHLVFSGLSLSGEDGRAVDVRSASSVLITLEGANTISDARSGKPSALNSGNDAVIFSRADVAIGGTGSLALVGSRSHGIATLGKLTLTGGKLDVSTAGAGLIGETCVRFGGATVSIEAEKEGVLSDVVFGTSLTDYESVEKKESGYIYVSGGVLTVVSTGDAVSSKNVFIMKDGVLDLTSGVRIEDFGVEEEPEETLPDFWDIFNFDIEEDEASAARAFVVFSDGVSAGSDLLVYGGTLSINASNHALYSGGTISVDGGRLYLSAVHDGVCADGAVGISDGIVILPKSRVGVLGESVDVSGGYLYVGVTNCGVKTPGAFRLSGGVCLVAGAKELPLDFGVATATGGVLVALGNAKKARDFFPTGEQGALLCYFESQGEAYPLLLCDNTERVLLSLEGKSKYNCAYFSSHELLAGDVYTLMSGGFVVSSDPYGFAMNADTSVAATPLGVVTVGS